MSIQEQLEQPFYKLEGFSFYAANEPPTCYEEHRHDELEICLMLNDAAAQVEWLPTDGGSKYRQISADKLCIIPSHHSHTLAWDMPADYILIFLHPSFVLQTTYEWTLSRSVQFEGQYAISDSLIHSLALTMRSAFDNQEFIDHLYIDSLVNVLAMYLLKAHSDCQSVISNSPRPQRWLRQTLDYIHDSLGQDLRLSTLANIAQMSESSFCHLFKEQMSISPHQYVIRQRIEKARLLLIDKKLPIVEIAYDCGFNSQSHLTLYFRQHVGITPKAYQDAH
ncbi:helix-turn-helix domain-containing protein [Acaryochloris marina]|uniref:AraC family transcriptional regulator n=1 Tax=Acaryochloris marina TaxID=155978 RepID=UPI001BAF26E8|nr:helix-turn-helix domain-containing protein [Acaryochloris marina]QUY44955.1 helix-turn-helix transcriptional regulator [Acaryochloris marina S15]